MDKVVRIVYYRDFFFLFFYCFLRADDLGLINTLDVRTGIIATRERERERFVKGGRDCET